MKRPPCVAPAICHLGRLVEDEEILRGKFEIFIGRANTMIKMKTRLVMFVRGQVDTEARSKIIGMTGTISDVFSHQNMINDEWI